MLVGDSDMDKGVQRDDVDKKGVAYLYARCDRESREHFYSLIKEAFTQIHTSMQPSSQGSQQSSEPSGQPSANKRAYISKWVAEAIGVCQGSNLQPLDHKRNQRYSSNYVTEAIEWYKHYRFVISFENTNAVNGYMTEKLVLPRLAGLLLLCHYYVGLLNTNVY